MAEILTSTVMRTPEFVASPGGIADHLYAFLSDFGTTARQSQLVQFGPFVVAVNFHGFTPATSYGRALKPASNPQGKPDFTIDVIDGAACGLPELRLAWQAADFGRKRTVPGWSDSDHTTYLLPEERGVAIADWTRQRAAIWVPSSSAVPWYERAAPFRWLFDNLAARLRMSMLHAAVIGREGVGVLIAGRGGVGKSTLALAALGRGLDYVGDDYCLVTDDGAPKAYGLYLTAKWKKDASVLPDWLMHTAPDALDLSQRKSIIFLDIAKPAQLVAHLSDRRDRHSVDRRCARSSIWKASSQQAALRSLAVSTVAQSEADGATLLQKIGRLVRTVPAYRLQMPRDPDASVFAIEQLLARATAESGRAHMSSDRRHVGQRCRARARQSSIPARCA